MKMLKQAALFLVSLSWLHASSGKQTCDSLFRCIDSRSFQLCSSTSNQTYSCEGGTFCSEDCTYPCTATPDCSPRCNTAGFHCTSDTEFQHCVDDDPPSGDVNKCPDSHVCSMSCDVECSPEACRNSAIPPDNSGDLPCDDVGIFPDVNNARNFHLCLFLGTGVLQASLYTCPEDFIFDANEACVFTGSTSVVSRPTTATSSCGSSQFRCLSSREFSVCVDGGPPEGRWTCPLDTFCREDREYPCSEYVSINFRCEREGKFSDPSNCNSYYLCVRKVSGSFRQMNFSCPAASFFNVMTEQCSRDPRACSLTTTPATTSTPTSTTPGPFVCTEAGRFPDPESCEHYFDCTKKWFSTGFKQSRRKCLLWTMFDSVRRKCVVRSAASCAVR